MNIKLSKYNFFYFKSQDPKFGEPTGDCDFCNNKDTILTGEIDPNIKNNIFRLCVGCENKVLNNYIKIGEMVQRIGQRRNAFFEKYVTKDFLNLLCYKYLITKNIHFIGDISKFIAILFVNQYTDCLMDYKSIRLFKYI